MKCKNCGFTINEEIKFCPSCGLKIQSESLDKTHIGLKTTLKRKKIIILFIALVAIMLLVGSVVYFNSSLRLENKFTASNWYLSPWDATNQKITTAGEIIEFRLDGSGVIKNYYIPEVDFGIAPRIYNGSVNIQWEILSDKTLKINGHYYKYKSEWYFEGSHLYIGNNEYANWNQFGYPDD